MREHIVSGLMPTTFGDNVVAPRKRVKEEIVRCRDCESATTIGKSIYCRYWADSEWDDREVHPGCFCAWGKRRDDERKRAL